MFVRVAGPVIAISAIPLIVGVASAWRVNASYKKVSRQLSLDVAGLRAGEELAIGIRDVRTDLNQYLRGDEQALQAAMNARQGVNHWITVAEQVAGTERDQQNVAHLRAAFETFYKQLDQITHGKIPPAQRRE